MNDFYVDIRKYINSDDNLYDDKYLEYCNCIYKTDNYSDIKNYDKFYANYDFFDK